MKKLILLILLSFVFSVLFISCANKSSSYELKNSTYRLIKTEKLVEHKLLSFASKSDTILLVTKINVSNKCVTDNLIKLFLQNNNRIQDLNDDGQNINFIYYSKGGENNNLKIITSSVRPGTESKQIFSYNALPYYMEKCK
jgi:NhaP-type Na+/H+ and K+/H+ antiporter